MSDLLERHAAVIGIDDYRGGITPLQSATDDALAVAGMLASKHDYKKTHLLIDAEATRGGILRLLEETLPAELGDRSALLLYFAGHGVAVGDGSAGPQGYLLPQNAERANDDSWISMERLHQALAKLSCRHLLMVLDCCYAGSFRWSATRGMVPPGKPLYDSQYARYLSGTAWQVLTSASHQQKAMDVTPGAHNTRDAGASQGHSPFAAAFLRGLAGKADSSRGDHDSDGVITATELHQYIYEELVPSGAKSHQTPGIWPLKEENTGEFIFLNPHQKKRTLADPPLDNANNPWRGLQTYGADDAALFFGRERVAGAILERLVDNAQTPFVAVVGASGVGKSSVVKAGVLPRLAAIAGSSGGGGGSRWTVVEVPRLERHPMRQLETALEMLKAAPAEGYQLLFIDQFEELYTQCPDPEEREQFLEKLREKAFTNLIQSLMAPGKSVLKVLITLRSDFEPRLAASEVMGDVLAAGRYLVPPPSSTELADIIDKPAAAKALYFEPPELTGELVDEVMAMPGALPLLSFALSETYRQAQLRRRQSGDLLDRALTRADYLAAGGVVGAIHRRATALYEAAEGDCRKTIRRVFPRLVTQEGGRLERRRVDERELEFADTFEQARVRKVIGDFVAARLLVRDEGHVEPAHATLVMAWDKLLNWLSRDGSQQLQRQVWQAASAWHEARGELGAKKARGLLWSEDPRLAQVQDPTPGPWRLAAKLLGRRRSPSPRRALWPRLNRLEQEFVSASVRRKQTRHTVFWAVAAIIVLMLFAMQERKDVWKERLQAFVDLRTAVAAQYAEAQIVAGGAKLAVVTDDGRVKVIDVLPQVGALLERLRNAEGECLEANERVRLLGQSEDEARRDAAACGAGAR